MDETGGDTVAPTPVFMILRLDGAGSPLGCVPKFTNLPWGLQKQNPDGQYALYDASEHEGLTRSSVSGTTVPMSPNPDHSVADL